MWTKSNQSVTLDTKVASKNLLTITAALLTTLLTSTLNPRLTQLTDGAICIATYAASITALNALNHEDPNNLESIAADLGTRSAPLKHLARVQTPYS